MKVTFFLLLLLTISSAQDISNEDEGRSLIHSNEQANELNGNLYGNGNIEVSTSLNNKNVNVTSKNMHKYEMFVTIRASLGGGKGGGGGGGKGGGGGGGGKGGGGKGGGGGGRKGGGGGGMSNGGAAGRTFSGGIFGNDGHNSHHHSHDSATTLSAWPHFCVLTLILCLSFWL
ncbi:hypothetical protein QL285_066411 [Trifolium repens]|nr:hypothetical protein QL285_066411 [Trifolium repens]